MAAPPTDGGPSADGDGAGFTVSDRRVSTQGAAAPSSGAAPAAPEAPTPHVAVDEDPRRPSAFCGFLASLHMAGLYHLGLMPADGGEAPAPNLDLARENIDIVEMLERKTRGNLDADEQRLIQHVLTDLRMNFLRASSGVGHSSRAGG